MSLMKFSKMFFFFFLFFFYFYFLSLFEFNTNSSLVSSFFILDEYSFFLSLLTFFILFISCVISMNFYSFFLSFILIMMTIFCISVFSSFNLFYIYMFYEASIIPIIVIILKWGSYPERSVGAMMLFIYTSLFSFPFMFILFFSFMHFGSFSLFMLEFSLAGVESSKFFSIFVFLTFSVKLPIYGLHFWLPMAHVEAPTFGSMILAGILLKLGGICLIRFYFLMNFEALKYYLISYLIVFTIVSTLICCFQSDFKRLVAYSSVSHMMSVPLLFLSSNFLSLKSLLLIMLLHGISSPVMFMFVGVLYSMFSSRQLILMRGILITSPLLSFMMILSFFLTLNSPPFPSFLGESFMMISSFFLTKYLLILFIPLIFLSVVYNLNWLSSILFSSNSYSALPVFSGLFFCLFLPFFFVVLLCVFFMLVFFFIL